MFETNAVKKIKTHIYVQQIFLDNRSVYETTRKNILEPYRPHDNIIRRMRFACWITKATYTRAHIYIHMGARACVMVFMHKTDNVGIT